MIKNFFGLRFKKLSGGVARDISPTDIQMVDLCIKPVTNMLSWMILCHQCVFQVLNLVLAIALISLWRFDCIHGCILICIIVYEYVCLLLSDLPFYRCLRKCNNNATTNIGPHGLKGKLMKLRDQAHPMYFLKPFYPRNARWKQLVKIKMSRITVPSDTKNI